MNKKNQKGFALIALLFGLVILGVVGLKTVDTYRSASIEKSHAIHKRDALGLAQAGISWTMRQFEADSDWLNKLIAVNGMSVSMDPGYFEVGVIGETSLNVTIQVTGNVPIRNDIIKRTMQLSLEREWKESQAPINVSIDAKFALFTPKPYLLNLSKTEIKGDVYNGGNVEVDATSSVTNGKVYIPSINTVTGPGVYTAEAINPTPPQAVPALDFSYYTDLMTSYNAYFTANNNVALSGTVDLSAAPYYGELRCKTLSFSDDCTIIGEGIIAAKRDIISRSHRLAVNPTSGKRIILAAGRNLQLQGKTSNKEITMERTILYSQDDGYLRLRYPYVTVHDSLLLAGPDSKLEIKDGAQVLDGVAYTTADDSNEEAFLMRSRDNYENSYFRGVVFVDTGTGKITGATRKRSQFEGLYYGNGTHQNCFYMDKSDAVGIIVANKADGGIPEGDIWKSTISYNAVLLPPEVPSGEGYWAADIVPFSWRGN